MTDSCVFFWTLAPSECASWVQAWGTIAALAVSIGVWLWQSSRAREDRIQVEIVRLTERVSPAIGLLSGMLQTLRHIEALAEERKGSVFMGWGRAYAEQFRSLLHEFQKVEAHLLPDADLALKAAQAKQLGVSISNWLKIYDGWEMVGVLVIEPARVEQLTGLRVALNDCQGAMRKRLVERSQLIINPDLKRSPVVDSD